MKDLIKNSLTFNLKHALLNHQLLCVTYGAIPSQRGEWRIINLRLGHKSRLDAKLTTKPSIRRMPMRVRDGTAKTTDFFTNLKDN